VQILFGSFVASLLNVISTEYLLPALPTFTGFRDMYLLGAFTTLITLVILFFYKEELDVESLRSKRLLKVNLESEDKDNRKKDVIDDSYNTRYTKVVFAKE
jgi:hypothetical protein